MFSSGASGAGYVTEELVGKLRQLSLGVDRATPLAPEPRPIGRIGLIVASLLVAAGVFVAGRYTAGNIAPSVSAQAQPDTAAEKPVPAHSALTASGYVVATRRATIAAQVTGQISSIYVQQGQHVQKGQLLARLDGDSARAAVANANASAAAAAASVRKLEAQSQEAADNRARVETLFNHGFATKRDLGAARASAASLAAEIEQARAAHAASAASLTGAGVTLSRFDIRAPFSGVVVDLNAQPGEVISPVSAGGGFTRTGICTIIDMNSLEIEVDVPEAYISRVAAGMAVTGTLDAFPADRLSGRVLAIVPVADRGKASLKVRISIERAPLKLMPEMAVRIQFDEAATQRPKKAS
jgi:HlyD family secretion protein